uniref:COX assembly mitochondrial protein n=1 Tax=Leersia perrieri TaxID=77586 RepID=A0A0D9VH60_9ORYZ
MNESRITWTARNNLDAAHITHPHRVLLSPLRLRAAASCCHGDIAVGHRPHRRRRRPEFQKCHLDHPVKKFFGECTSLKIKLDRCFRQEKALKRKANIEESKKFKEQLLAYKREIAETNQE